MQPNILYVEDDRENRDVMQVLVTEVMGIPNLAIFEDSSDFLSRVDALPYDIDVIFLDIHVTPLNGFEMLKLLRASGIYKGVPVVAITASVMNEEIQTLKDAGFDGVLAKPLDMDRFPNLLQKILNRQPVWTIVE